MVWRREDINAPFRLYTHRQMVPLHQTASYSPGSTHSHRSPRPPLPPQWYAPAPFWMMVGGWGDRTPSVFPSHEMLRVAVGIQPNTVKSNTANTTAQSRQENHSISQKPPENARIEKNRWRDAKFYTPGFSRQVLQTSQSH